jgi:hypothetical protein
MGNKAHQNSSYNFYSSSTKKLARVLEMSGVWDVRIMNATSYYAILDSRRGFKKVEFGLISSRQK